MPLYCIFMSTGGDWCMRQFVLLAQWACLRKFVTNTKKLMCSVHLSWKPSLYDKREKQQNFMTKHLQDPKNTHSRCGTSITLQFCGYTLWTTEKNKIRLRQTWNPKIHGMLLLFEWLTIKKDTVNINVKVQICRAHYSFYYCFILIVDKL